MGSHKSHQDKAYFSFPTHCVFFKSYIIFGLFIFMQHPHYSALLMTPKRQEINTVFMQDQAVDTGQRPQQTCPTDFSKAVSLSPLRSRPHGRSASPMSASPVSAVGPHPKHHGYPPIPARCQELMKQGPCTVHAFRECMLILHGSLTHPDSISNMRMPSAHQSTALPWPLLWMTSGARYSGVPHRVHVLRTENTSPKLRCAWQTHSSCKNNNVWEFS